MPSMLEQRAAIVVGRNVILCRCNVAIAIATLGKVGKTFQSSVANHISWLATLSQQ